MVSQGAGARQQGLEGQLWGRPSALPGRELRRTQSPPKLSVETKPSFANALPHHGPGKATRIGQSPMRHKSKAVNRLVMNHMCRNWGLFEVKRSPFSDSCHIAK